MNALAGRWALTMQTPIGSIDAELAFFDHDGTFTGTATGKSEVVPLQDVRVTTPEEGVHVTWTQAITRPLRLNLAFDVTTEGDIMHGHSRAGRLPRSTVDGRRLAG